MQLTDSDVTSLYALHNTAHHFWDFRGCTIGARVTDGIAGDLMVTPMDGPTCSSDGIVLDGNDDYADIDDWEWGSATCFEVCRSTCSECPAGYDCTCATTPCPARKYSNGGTSGGEEPTQ